MRIVADENIVYVQEAFGAFGELETFPGRAITNEVLAGAEILLVRSVTQVNAALLEGTSVRFVGTATAGEDHIDQEYLRDAGIQYASAPGSNADSVAEYVIAALMVLEKTFELSLEQMSLGIVGVGHVGRRVLRRARALGMRCILNDPPLAGATAEPVYRTLEEALTCDIVSFHTPLERNGLYPTWHLADAAFLRGMKPGAFLINSARGEVVDNAALLAAIESGHLRAAVLDVWENEPRPDLELMARCSIATPHIAGYSFDGKVKGTLQIQEALCRFLGTDGIWDARVAMPAAELPELLVAPAEPQAVGRAVLRAYDILADDARMREISGLPKLEQGSFFDRLRKQYPRRREFLNTEILLAHEDKRLERVFRGLGFGGVRIRAAFTTT